MISPEKLNYFSSKIKEITKNSPIEDINKNIDALLKGALTKMELVSREEFDIQTELLVKTQAKLTTLEAKLAVLESLLKAQESANNQSV